VKFGINGRLRRHIILPSCHMLAGTALTSVSVLLMAWESTRLNIILHFFVSTSSTHFVSLSAMVSPGLARGAFCPYAQLPCAQPRTKLHARARRGVLECAELAVVSVFICATGLNSLAPLYTFNACYHESTRVLILFDRERSFKWDAPHDCGHFAEP